MLGQLAQRVVFPGLGRPAGQRPRQLPVELVITERRFAPLGVANQPVVAVHVVLIFVTRPGVAARFGVKGLRQHHRGQPALVVVFATSELLAIRLTFLKLIQY